MTPASGLQPHHLLLKEPLPIDSTGVSGLFSNGISLRGSTMESKQPCTEEQAENISPPGGLGEKESGSFGGR